ncbi:hypothetical protein [Pseudodesulfovibrio tunisiensis]|uniref:hypothetical protein n=1 Tax=Pseudodesulfovibrio tunisiensis TaxID=463192 RepID=UPI001FB274B4|nr:hypothetical protein [Pseudodesulfovibrio tunisiensis]
MDAKLTIHFKGQPNGSTLATVVLIVAGFDCPEFYREILPSGVDPWAVYNDIATNALVHLRKEKRSAPPDKAPDTTGKKQGKVIQLHAVLPI